MQKRGGGVGQVVGIHGRDSVDMYSLYVSSQGSVSISVGLTPSTPPSGAARKAVTRSTPYALPAAADAFTYDGLGRMSTAVREIGGSAFAENIFAYNDLSYMTSESQRGFDPDVARVVQYGYDQVGNRMWITYPSGIGLSYTYDGLSRVDEVERDAGGGPVLVADYDYAGLYLDHRRLFTDYGPCPVWVDYDPDHDEHRRMHHIGNTVSTSSWSGPTLSDNAYTFDKVGSVTRVTPDASANYSCSTNLHKPLQKEIAYEYDTLHRLTTAIYVTDDEETDTFQMDLVSNREQYTPRSGDPLIYTHTPANEYDGVGLEEPLTPRAHDAAGNLTGDERGYGYVYDFENRLVAVFDDADADGEQDPGEPTLALYGYDALGRRVEHTAGTRWFRYYYAGRNVVAEYNMAVAYGGYLQRYYVNGSSYVDERLILHEALFNEADYYYVPRLRHKVFWITSENAAFSLGR